MSWVNWPALLAGVAASVLGLLVGWVLARRERRHRDRDVWPDEWLGPPTNEPGTDDVFPHARSDDFIRSQRGGVRFPDEWLGRWMPDRADGDDDDR